MAKHWFKRPGYKGYGDAARYLASDECGAWLDKLAEPNRSWELEALSHERKMDALQLKRDGLADKVGASFVQCHWSMYEDPERQLAEEIEALEAIQESREAASDSPSQRLHRRKLARRQGYEHFKKSGLTANAYSKRAPAHYFPHLRTGDPVGPRQIVRILEEHEDGRAV